RSHFDPTARASGSVRSADISRLRSSGGVEGPGATASVYDPARGLTSRELRLTRDRHGRDGERDIPIVPRRRQVLLRSQRLLPGDDLAGIRRHPAHDRQERALRHVRTVVDRLAPPDAGEERIVLGLEDVGRRAVVAPGPAGLDPRAAPPAASVQGGPPLRAQHLGADLVGAAHLLPAGGQQLRPALVLVGDREVVIDMAVFRPGPLLPAAGADGPGRVTVLHRPRAGVEQVDVLLDVEVARQPGEVVPVAHLPDHVAPVALTRLDPDRPTVVGRLQDEDLADGAVTDPPDGLAEAFIIAHAQAGDDRQALRLRPLAGGQ